MLFRICPFRQWIFFELSVSGTVLGLRVEQLSLCNTHNCIASLGKKLQRLKFLALLLRMESHTLIARELLTSILEASVSCC